MVNSARAKSSLGNFKSATFAKQNIGNRNRYIFKQYFHVAVRCVIVSKNI